MDRDQLLEACDIVVSLKPKDEWKKMRPNSVLVGWFNHLGSNLHNPHNVTLLDLEDITTFVDGRDQKILWENARVAGECGVHQTLDRLTLMAPSSPAISHQQLAVVFGYGNLGRGAVLALLKRGIQRIVVFTQRPPTEVQGRLPGVEYRQMEHHGADTLEVLADGSKRSLMDDLLPQADIIVNAKKPSRHLSKWVFVPEDRFAQLKPGMAFIDPVHIDGNGANFVHTTSLEEPLKKISRAGRTIWFNGCNAMPSHDPAYASSVISQALIREFDTVMAAVLDRMLLTGALLPSALQSIHFPWPPQVIANR